MGRHGTEPGLLGSEWCQGPGHGSQLFFQGCEILPITNGGDDALHISTIFPLI
jgi:hypothetical protein